jgi:hypothetical protein
MADSLGAEVSVAQWSVMHLVRYVRDVCEAPDSSDPDSTLIVRSLTSATYSADSPAEPEMYRRWRLSSTSNTPLASYPVSVQAVSAIRASSLGSGVAA